MTALTSAQFVTLRSEFGYEDFVYLTVCNVSREKSDELFRGITSLHIKGEHTAVLTADCAGRTLQLYRVVIPDSVITSQECVDSGNKGEDTV